MELTLAWDEFRNIIQGASKSLVPSKHYIMLERLKGANSNHFTVKIQPQGKMDVRTKY